MDYSLHVGSRVSISTAHLECTPTLSGEWRRARYTDGAAEGATFCSSFEPLTSSVVAARPTFCHRHCVCGGSCVLSFCVSPFLCLFLCVWHNDNTCQSSVDCQWKFKTGLSMPHNTSAHWLAVKLVLLLKSPYCFYNVKWSTTLLTWRTSSCRLWAVFNVCNA